MIESVMKKSSILLLVLFLLVPLTAHAQAGLGDAAAATGVASQLVTGNMGTPAAPTAATPAATQPMSAPDAIAAVAAVGATDAAPADPAAASPPVVDLNTPFVQSFLFTPAELVALRRAAEGAVVGAAVLGADNTTYIPPRRVISVAGIFLRAPGDWIVWLNGKKMTPKDLLPEVMDISVQRDRVHLKWFDIGLNNIISITLRPHQTYDIVTGVLLPG